MNIYIKKEHIELLINILCNDVVFSEYEMTTERRISEEKEEIINEIVGKLLKGK